MPLILVRHGQTKGNRHSYVGHQDLPLDDTGLAQARQLADELSSEKITNIYSSPLRRAVETVQPLANRLNLSIEQRDGLMEIDFGTLQGALKGTAPLNLRREHLLTPLPGGECLADVWRRLEPVVAELLERVHSGAFPVVVGHYWSNRLLRDMLLGVSLAEALLDRGYKPSNGSAITIDFH